jgi:hypothetical protein
LLGKIGLFWKGLPRTNGLAYFPLEIGDEENSLNYSRLSMSPKTSSTTLLSTTTFSTRPNRPSSSVSTGASSAISARTRNPDCAATSGKATRIFSARKPFFRKTSIIRMVRLLRLRKRHLGDRSGIGGTKNCGRSFWVFTAPSSVVTSGPNVIKLFKAAMEQRTLKM